MRDKKSHATAEINVQALSCQPGLSLRFVEHMSGDGISREACRLKLKGIVSKRKDFGFRSGPSKNWLKVKNPEASEATDSTRRGMVADAGRLKSVKRRFRYRERIRWASATFA
jgi:hypothetical protein